MASKPRAMPRFLPTLTEVVEKPALVPTEPTISAPDRVEAARLIETVVQQAGQAIGVRIQDAVERFQANQMQLLMDDIQSQIAPVVREAVAQALAAQTRPHKSNS